MSEPEPTPSFSEPVTNLNSQTLSDKSVRKALTHFKPWVLGFVGSFLLLIFVWRLNFNLVQIGTLLVQANLLAIFVSILLILPILVIKTWRWGIILAERGNKSPFRNLFHIYALGLSIGSFTPGQAGDTIKAWYLRELGFPLSTGLLSVLLDRLFDLAVLLVLAVSSLLLLGSSYLSELPILLIFLALITIALIVTFTPALRRNLVGFILKHLLPLKPKIVWLNKEWSIGNKIAVLQQLKQEGTNIYDRFFLALLLTIITAAFAVARTWLLGLSIGLNFSLIEVVVISSLATVAGLLPFTIGGIGTRDLVLVGIFNEFGFDREKAITLSTLLLMLNLVNLVGGYIIWITRQKPKQLAVKQSSHKLK